ncbi:6-phospho 3-hexuloisomerase [Gordoniibacillus kamchatkensis]|uniref:6-phospho 3-hexuloisomerase n=1 Tax=Gordoniibacillus kamchatkensis TaxID=1590651 RepID=A0ABR5AL39_9BACL|nr:6-phospho-3-hexuloisomerase [Paenibacillus sp. VKM B-2647]KIL41508.1 6-phospho 3-hexuloisomerase [Paenibacillus sp. VKM B-2647]
MDNIQAIMAEIGTVLNKVRKKDIAETAESLAKGKRIFVVGEGRSGLMAKSFAMRMMHLGATAYAVGETITPSMSAGDLLVAVSGSGTTKNVVWIAEKARELGCTVIGMTTDEQSLLGRCASKTVLIPAATKYRREGEAASIQPLGSLFDQCIHIVLDAICLEYADIREVDNSKAFRQHSNVE